MWVNVHRLYKPIIQLALADWNSSVIKVIEDTTLLWNQYCLAGLKQLTRPKGGKVVAIVMFDVEAITDERNYS